ncbi:MAG: NAD(P)H-binding protein [Candidatus Zixiibacteriota bacterium]
MSDPINEWLIPLIFTVSKQFIFVFISDMNVMRDKPILVIGGTGHYGSYIVNRLLNKSAKVRVLSRNAAKARKILGDAPEIIEGDITSKESVRQSLDAAGGVIISISAFSPKLIRKMEQIEREAVLMVLAEAEKLGVSRIVYISIYDIKLELPGDFDFMLRKRIARLKLDVENALGESKLNFTILGAPASMEIFFAMMRGNSMFVPGGSPPALFNISPLDLGEIAAQAVFRNDLKGKRFRMTGPKALSFKEAAGLIGRAVGKNIAFRKIPMFFPRLVQKIIYPVAPFSDRFYFINQMINFIRILSNFPQDLIDDIPKDYQKLLDTFEYAPTTLEQETRRRFGDST